MTKVWLDLTKTLEEPVASDAASFGAIRAERPNRFVVLFPSERSAQRESCAKNEDIISANLEKKLNSSVSLTLVIDPSISNRVPSSIKTAPRRQHSENSKTDVPSLRETSRSNFAPTPQNSFSGKRNNEVARQTPRVNSQEIRRQFEQNEVVQEIKECFEAELGEIKKATPHPQNTSNSYAYYGN